MTKSVPGGTFGRIPVGTSRGSLTIIFEKKSRKMSEVMQESVQESLNSFRDPVEISC